MTRTISPSNTAVAAERAAATSGIAHEHALAELGTSPAQSTKSAVVAARVP